MMVIEFFLILGVIGVVAFALYVGYKIGKNTK